jgi:hypothetical protein
MSEELRSQISAIIRQDLAAEAAAGFPLLARFPNSETASVPGAFAALGAAERESLLDALAHYSMVQWTHAAMRERQAHPVLRRYLVRRPVYPPGDWYGARPRKSALKKSVVGHLAQAGFVRKKQPPGLPPDVMRFSHPDPGFAGYLGISFDPGSPRQLDFGFYDWLRGDLRRHFEFSDPRAFIPIVLCLAYDHVWDGHGTNNPICWDVITAANLEETCALMIEVLGRLTALAARINSLASPPAPD